jgi:chitin disaccharide deacetylase
MKPHTRSLCICVDDYGLHEGINRAAIELAQRGRVHAISCLTAGPDWKQHAQWLLPAAAQGVDVGLHLDFTEATSGQSQRWPLGELIRASLLRQLNRRLIRQEIKLQLEAFEQALGRAPAYVDGHQHVHQLPGVREELLAELGQRYQRQLPWLRSTRSQGLHWSQLRADWRAAVKPWGIEQLGARGLSAQARAQGYLQNQRLLGVYDFKGGAVRYANLLQQWLACAQAGDLLMCHPSHKSSAGDALLPARQAEFEVLAGDALGQLLSEEGIDLRPMGQIQQ